MIRIRFVLSSNRAAVLCIGKMYVLLKILISTTLKNPNQWNERVIDINRDFFCKNVFFLSFI